MALLNFNPATLGLLGDTMAGVGMGLLNQRPGDGMLGGFGSGLQYAQGLQQQRKSNQRLEEQQKLAQAQLQIAQQTAAQQQQAFAQQQAQQQAQKQAAQSLFGGQAVPSNPMAFPAGAPPQGSSVGVSQPNPAFANMSHEQLAVMQRLAQANPGAALDMAAQQAFTEPKAPTTREILRGNQRVYQQFNTKTGQFEDVSSGPAFAPQQPKTPDLMTLISPDGSNAQSIDVTTSSGAQKMRELISQGYVERSGADPNSKPFTEDQAKTSQLLTEIVGDPQSGVPGDYQIAKQNFDALKVLKDQIGGKTPEAIQSFVTSPEYQRAKNAVAHIIANNLYSLSGAAITDDEAQRRASILMPVPGESDASMQDKLNRIDSMVYGMKKRGGRAAAGIEIPSFEVAPPPPTMAPALPPPPAPPVQKLPPGFN